MAGKWQKARTPGVYVQHDARSGRPRYKAAYRDARRVVTSKTFPTVKLAEAYLHEMHVKRATGSVPDSSHSRKTVQMVKQVGQYGRHVQTHEIREKLSYSEGSDEAHYMHNVIGRLKKQGIVEVVGDMTRKRNQYMRVADDRALRLKLDRSSGNGRVARPVSAGAVADTNGPPLSVCSTSRTEWPSLRKSYSASIRRGSPTSRSDSTP